MGYKYGHFQERPLVQPLRQGARQKVVVRRVLADKAKLSYAAVAVPSVKQIRQ